MSDHANQINDYPKGARIEAIREIPLSSPSQNYFADPLPCGTKGRVTSHTDDGRAWINFDDCGNDGMGHTFDEPEKYIRVIPSTKNYADDEPPAPRAGEGNAKCSHSDKQWHLSENNPADIMCEYDYIASGTTRKHAAQILAEHNQYATLVAQREQLLVALKQCVSLIRGNNELAKVIAEPHVLKLADDALATIEQEGEGTR